jgi:hypothetical protein
VRFDFESTAGTPGLIQKIGEKDDCSGEKEPKGHLFHRQRSPFLSA